MGMTISKNELGSLIDIYERSLIEECVDKLKVEAVKLIEMGEKHITINIPKTEYIDSSGIGKILFINRKLIANGGILEITNITPSLLDFFEMLSIDKVLKINR